jgi:FkbM family methyltransferase
MSDRYASDPCGRTMRAAITELGTPLYVLDDDPRGDQMIATGGNFNPTSRLIWQCLCRRSAWATIVDVGANYGEMILTFALPSEAHVWAFEPAPAVAECLLRSIAEVGAPVDVVQAAVGASTGLVDLFEDPQWSGSTTATRAHAAVGSVQRSVEAIRLDDFLFAHDLKPMDSVLIKLDVEGGERDALSGLLPILPSADQVVILCEILHTVDEDLEWMIERFYLHLVADPYLRPVPVATVADFHRLMDSGRFYKQDAILADRLLSGALQ